MSNLILSVLTLGMIRPKFPMKTLLIIAAIVGYAVVYSPQAFAQAQRMDYNCEDHLHDDLAAMACNIYWEGRNQDSEGMMAVAAVTLWRVRHPSYPDTIADVVWEKNWSTRFQRFIAMFSWTLDGKKDHPFKNEQAQWDEAWLIARNFAISSEQKDRMCPHINITLEAWNGMEEKGEIVERKPIKCEAYEQLLEAKFYMMEILDPTGGAIMYHADYVTPWWMDAYNFTTKLGDHLFYNDETPDPDNFVETPELPE